jgi:hypothetical protein
MRSHALDVDRSDGVSFVFLPMYGRGASPSKSPLGKSTCQLQFPTAIQIGWLSPTDVP